MASSTIHPVNMLQFVPTNATDMDDLTTPGVIYTTNNITENRPASSSYWEVIPLKWAQIAIQGNSAATNVIYIRQRTTTNGWNNPWKKITLTTVS